MENLEARVDELETQLAQTNTKLANVHATFAKALVLIVTIFGEHERRISSNKAVNVGRD